VNELCKCGCGKEVTNDKNRFLHGHSNRGRKDLYLKRAKSYKEKYGVENPNQLQEIKEKKKKTCQQKYSVNNPFQLKEIKDKIRQENIEKYGGPAPMCSKKVQEQTRQTNLKLYGNEYPIRLKEFQEKTIKKYKENWGVNSSNQSEIVKEKKKQTCKKHWGVDHWMKTPQGRRSARKISVKYVEDQKLNGEPLCPRIGIPERNCLNDFRPFISYKIIRCDHSIFDLVAFFPDGHIPELKLFIEFDERQHFENYEMTIYKQEDVDRELALASLGYMIFRVSEKQWKENKEKIISDFKDFITLLEQGRN
jgi:hypothetical protein